MERVQRQRHKCEPDKHAIPGSKKDFDLIMSVLKGTLIVQEEVILPSAILKEYFNEQKFYDWVKCHIY